MSDLSLCANDYCKQKHECYRFMAVRDPLWNCFSEFKPNEHGQCSAFFPIRDRPVRNIDGIE